MYSGSFLLFNVCINSCNYVIHEVPASKRHSQFNHGQLTSLAVYSIGFSEETKQQVYNVYFFKVNEMCTIKSIVIHLSIQDCREKKDTNIEYNHFFFG